MGGSVCFFSIRVMQTIRKRPWHLLMEKIWAGLPWEFSSVMIRTGPWVMVTMGADRLCWACGYILRKRSMRGWHSAHGCLEIRVKEPEKKVRSNIPWDLDMRFPPLYF